MVVPGKKSGGLRLRWLLVGVAVLAAVVGLFLVQLLFGPDPAPTEPMTAEQAQPPSETPTELLPSEMPDGSGVAESPSAPAVPSDSEAGSMPSGVFEMAEEEEIVVIEGSDGDIEDVIVVDESEAVGPSDEAETPAPADASATSGKTEAASAPPLETAAKGGFAVQLMSVHDESNIAESWAAMQKKFPAILGGKTLDIEEADLGDRGIFYRIRALGFVSEATADKACAELKEKGQDCLVLPNT